ncbi:hypothetical protein [Georgenia sp. SUBG003]|uniref:hypothetical protein n=1 Tax=Georgenia sp. SUBG003 TaxID=1497974 RepID=UPI003AB214AD
MEPYVGHPHEVLGRIRLDEALAAAELARLVREQPDRMVRRALPGAVLLARLRARVGADRVAAARRRTVTASARTSAGQASLGVVDC